MKKKEVLTKELAKISLIKIDGVQGTFDKEGFQDYTKIISWSTGASVYDRRATVQDFFIIMDKSNTSLNLFRTLVMSKVIPSLTFIVIESNEKSKSKPKILFRLIMTNVTVSSFQMGGHELSKDLNDSISLNYESGVYQSGDFDENQNISAENSINFFGSRSSLD